MKLAKWDPFHEVDGLMDRYARSLDWPLNEGHRLRTRDFDWAPKADISETDGKFCITAELPGLKRDDVQINIEDHVLCIKGESKQEQEEESEAFHRIERQYGHFTRSFSLPENVDEEHIAANFNDGLLTLTIPKTEKEKAKSIEIKVK